MSLQAESIDALVPSEWTALPEIKISYFILFLLFIKGMDRKNYLFPGMK
jgi:hypothetical protein